MIHSLTADGLAPRVKVTCDECGTLGVFSTDKGADIAIAQHDIRWSR